MRLRTLPLSLSGIVLAVLLAAADYQIYWLTAVLLMLTAVCLQILSNLSNELGDTLSGTDTAGRQGIRYSLQEGALGVPQMKRLIAVMAALSCLCGLAMVWSSFGTVFGIMPAAFLALGALAVLAAVRYTLGKNPYGYRGLGDIAVFIFFGLATVLGGFFLCTRRFGSPELLLPACAVGMLSVGVLNVNNIRDARTDAATRTTVAIRLGGKRARIYQTLLVVSGVALMTVYAVLRGSSLRGYLYLLTLPLFVMHLKGVWGRDGRELDPMLPLLVMGTFAMCLLAGIGQML